MKIKYLGPRESINVAPLGLHYKGEVREYPDDVGEELLATSKKQRFEVAELTVAQLKENLDEAGVQYPPRSKKADLAALWAEYEEKKGSEE